VRYKYNTQKASKAMEAVCKNNPKAVRVAGEVAKVLVDLCENDEDLIGFLVSLGRLCYEEHLESRTNVS
jgi:hypothetical protein